MISGTTGRQAAGVFVEEWIGKGYEKGETQRFWISLLHNVFGIDDPTQMMEFEIPVKTITKEKGADFIDAYIPSTKVLIEQKGSRVDLGAKAKQSDGAMLTPYQQGRRYAAGLPQSQYPRWIVACNFISFEVHDMEHPNDAPEIIQLADLEKEYTRLSFLVDDTNVHLKKELEVSIQAGEIVGVLYDKILAQYKDPSNPDSQKALNKLCVRLVFCLYAEDAGIFGSKNMFHDYLARFETRDIRKALIDLFSVLNTPVDQRDPYMDEALSAFPYVNGGLFGDAAESSGRAAGNYFSVPEKPISAPLVRRDADIEIPQFTEEIRTLILQRASGDFDWSLISPTIFGAVFESTLNPETRRAGGMHYTSIENIHKVIDPLFLDNLKSELAGIKAIAVAKTRRDKAVAFQNKLAAFKFLDPACGSGNFLTESYTSLRRLENEAIRLIYGSDRIIGEMANPIKVSINQFYGIEINDFACSVAQTALWIAESQMMQETDEIVGFNLDPLPLKTYNNIREGNALRMDWDVWEDEDNNPVIVADRTNVYALPEGYDSSAILQEPVVRYGEIDVYSREVSMYPGGKPRVFHRVAFDYIMGNPPFVGYSNQNGEQKKDLLSVLTDEKGKPYKAAGKVDYVAGWYFKTAALMQESPSIRAAFVSTNSITQGEQAAAIWRPLSGRYGIHIDFAWRTFVWDSEASEKAHVHCVIIGFSACHSGRKGRIFDGKEILEAFHINPYLLDADNVFIDSRTAPLCDVKSLLNGGKPTEGGFLILTEGEKNQLLRENPLAEEFIRPYMMGKDFIDRKPRFCLWLVHAEPSVLRKCPGVLERIGQVKAYRMASPKAATRKKAETPQLFDEVREFETDYIAIPKVSSQNRHYIPMEYLPKDIIPGDKLFCLPDATLYDLGVLTSSVHMAWMRITCGRLKSDYSYSNTVVYNNFPWAQPTERQKERISQTAQGILDARALYPDSSLADLYDERTMPPALRKAHRANDAAVMEAYGFRKDMTEPEMVAELFKLYQKLI